MFSIKVKNTVPLQLRKFAVLANKTIGAAILEEARFLAQRLLKLTPPKNAKEGKNRVENDIGKVYLSSSWFLEKFSFKNQTFGDRVKDIIRRKDQTALQDAFEKSPKLSRLHIEPFKDSIIKKFRTKGRVSDNVTPSSFPVSDEKGRKDYQKKKQSNVGLVKSGWANCLKALGGAVSGWLRKDGTGHIIDRTSDKTNPRVSLVNSVRYAAQLDRDKGISQAAMAGRARDLERKTQGMLDRIKKG